MREARILHYQQKKEQKEGKLKIGANERAVRAIKGSSVDRSRRKGVALRERKIGHRADSRQDHATAVSG